MRREPLDIGGTRSFFGCIRDIVGGKCGGFKLVGIPL